MNFVARFPNFSALLALHLSGIQGRSSKAVIEAVAEALEASADSSEYSPHVFGHFGTIFDYRQKSLNDRHTSSGVYFPYFHVITDDVLHMMTERLS